jgi:hypothetical protein
MVSAPKPAILLAACFLGPLALLECAQGETAMPTPMVDINGMPTPIVTTSEKFIKRQEIKEMHPDFMARIKKVIEGYEGINLNSEKITYREDIGYIFRYEILHDSAENVSSNPASRSFIVLWTKDFEGCNAATYSGFDFPSPL